MGLAGALQSDGVPVSHVFTSSGLSIDFAKNLGEDKTTLAFTAAELAGMPDDFMVSTAPEQPAGTARRNSPATLAPAPTDDAPDSIFPDLPPNMLLRSAEYK